MNIIDFSKYNGPVYSGRARGERARIQANLDVLDKSVEKIEISVPDDTLTVTSSFFLGMFGPSVIRSGSREAFEKRFNFKIPSFLKGDFDEYISYALLKKQTLFS
mgnify:CR=1 FL=1